ncbi:hypothetical protein H696_05262 [Fonticula alba]|uniref:FAD/NAD(P)-binding domain-containing protein n=1 Tax=Fonticula alba TaxID=691883 RepID=A0A058Z251_FONAL|nr:hypothetical protein H696_05262 [Fonticula alba]KCV68345.1 hypothetical protein H696_05262 [Fonticula alba]|eukprot:XP_009497399.1 hypothetical protein H696_05262 [Fonticula alba]
MLHPLRLFRASPHLRHFSTMAAPARTFDALVVGAGPAGAAAVGNLLESGATQVAWVDPLFTGGRIPLEYNEVPSNTKVTFFVQYATGVQPFRDVIAQAASKGENAFSKLEAMDQNTGCELSHAGELVRFLTDGLRERDDVSPIFGSVEKLAFDAETNTWSASVTGKNGPASIAAERVVLASGSHPLSLPAFSAAHPELREIPLDISLSPSKLTSFVGPEDVVAVIGSSHSAVLAVRNLMHANVKEVRNYFRSPLRYAQFMDGWIRRDNTGLKGEAAIWAQQNLDAANWRKHANLSRVCLTPGADVDEDGMIHNNVVEDRSATTPDLAHEQAIYAETLRDVTKIVFAVGFARNSLPELVDAASGQAFTDLDFDHKTGTFRAVPRLYGCGIAFPQEVTDPDGRTEHAVGFFKFMRFLRAVTPTWVNDKPVAEEKK